MTVVGRAGPSRCAPQRKNRHHERRKRQRDRRASPGSSAPRPRRRSGDRASCCELITAQWSTGSSVRQADSRCATALGVRLDPSDRAVCLPFAAPFSQSNGNTLKSNVSLSAYWHRRTLWVRRFWPSASALTANQHQPRFAIARRRAACAQSRGSAISPAPAPRADAKVRDWDALVADLCRGHRTARPPVSTPAKIRVEASQKDPAAEVVNSVGSQP
jgi:hypothetical protein